MNAGYDPHDLTKRLAGNCTNVFNRNRIPFLRHDRGSLHVAVRQPDHIEFSHGHQQEFLREFTHIDQHGRGRTEQFREIVNRCNRAVTVAGRPAKAEQFRDSVSVDRKSGSRDRAGAERAVI